MLTQRFLELNLLGSEWVNWTLVLFSLVGVAITADRLILYIRTRERFLPLQAALQESLRRQDLSGARALVATDTLVRNVLRAGLDAVARGERDSKAVEEEMLAALAAQRSRYDARVAWLTTIANIAPLVGLLGTIIGIVGAFYGLGQAGTPSRRATRR
jgi:biopolymer transport protein ExbB